MSDADTLTVQFLDEEEVAAASQNSHSSGSDRLTRLVEAGKERVLSVEGVEIVAEEAGSVTVTVREGALETLEKVLRTLVPQGKILKPEMVDAQ